MLHDRCPNCLAYGKRHITKVITPLVVLTSGDSHALAVCKNCGVVFDPEFVEKWEGPDE